MHLNHIKHDNKISHPYYSPLLFKADVSPLTDVLSAMNMRSCLIFPSATVAHSGKYICHVLESVQDQTASASVNITVLG